MGAGKGDILEVCEFLLQPITVVVDDAMCVKHVTVAMILSNPSNSINKKAI